MTKITLGPQLELDKCPHCSIDKPNLALFSRYQSNNHTNTYARHWGFYSCSRCGGVVTAYSFGNATEIREYFPTTPEIDKSIPDRARAYLQQAQDTIHSGAASVMCSASAVDAMLKIKSYKEGSLYSRIEAAASAHLITEAMAKWAHSVRLPANEQRHADEETTIPTTAEAQHTLEFAKALAQFLFVLPARVEHGIVESTTTSTTTNKD